MASLSERLENIGGRRSDSLVERDEADKTKAPKALSNFWRSELLHPRHRQAFKDDKDASAASISIASQE
jgi:hypothetical protein